MLVNSGLTPQTLVLPPTLPLMLLQTSQVALSLSTSAAVFDLSGFAFHFSLYPLLFGSVLSPADLQVTSNTALVLRLSLTGSMSTALRGTMWSPQHASVRDRTTSSLSSLLQQHHLHFLHELQVYKCRCCVCVCVCYSLCV